MNLRRTKKLEDFEILYLLDSYEFHLSASKMIIVTYPKQPKRSSYTVSNSSSKLWFSVEMKRSTINLVPIVKKFFEKSNGQFNLIFIQSLYNNGIKIDSSDVKDKLRFLEEYDILQKKIFNITGKIY